MKRVALIAALVVVAAAAVVIGIGALLPQRHTASGTALLTAPPDRVFAAISDVRRYPEWRSSVSKVEMLGDRAGRWREYDGSDAITFELVEEAPPLTRRVRIADDDLPFGGTWTYTIAPADAGARVEIREDGEVYNPLFRFVSRFVIGHTSTIDTYLEDLRRYVGG